MPGAAPQPEINAEYAERFAALWAGFDTGNANDAEASGKGRELRRMAKAVNLRVVDVMGRVVVMAALDAQLTPEREESPELAEARQMAMDQCALAKEAVAKAEHWAEVAKRQEEIIAELRGPRTKKNTAPPAARASSFSPRVPAPQFGYVGGLLAFASVMAVAALLFACAARIAAAVFGGG